MFARRAFALLLSTWLFLVLPGAAEARSPSPSPSGGAQYEPPAPPPAPDPALADITVPGVVAQLLPDGSAAAPAGAPPQVQHAIWGANRLTSKPYAYGGGHGKFDDSGYDCSGTVSYALHAGGLLRSPLDSSSFMAWGAPGAGQWITVFATPGHTYAVLAGLRLDTSAAGDSRANGLGAAGLSRTNGPKAAERGPRWRPTLRSSRGYKRRHPLGF